MESGEKKNAGRRMWSRACSKRRSLWCICGQAGRIAIVIIAGHVAPPTNNPKEIAIEAMNVGWAEILRRAEHEFARGQALVVWSAKFAVAGAWAAAVHRTCASSDG